MERRGVPARWARTVELLVDAERRRRDALDAAEAEFHRLEAILSRFRPTPSSRGSTATGRLDAGPDLARVVELALDARERTGGRFDPTVHDAVVAAGYDRTFDVGRRRRRRRRAPRAVRRRRRVDGRRIELDAGVRLDLGGIGKGYAVERAAEILAAAGPCLVNAGGDIAVRGGAWPVGVETATARSRSSSSGALATSGRDRRRWRRAGRELHHLIDPATGAPARDRPRSA